jgi:small subunit ribosomal protein S17
MNTRRRITGVVTSNKMMKTVVVEITRTYQHPLYHKIVHSRKRVKAHDELSCKVGDKVVIVESQPISAEKHWVVEKLLRRERHADLPVQVEAAETEPDTEAGA